MAGAGDIVTNLIMHSGNFVAGAGSGLRAMRTLTMGIQAGTATISAALGPVTALFAGAFAASSAVAGARTQLQAEQKLAAVLAATGGAAQLSAQEIGDYASELQSATNYGDDVTLGAASILATFKEIKGDTFKGALAAAQDLSTIMGKDLNSSAVQLGKALNDPIRGITALSRVGVSFTQQQKEQIQAMQEAGDIAGAQQIILRELESEFGGAAKALADPWTQLQNTVGDIGDNIGFLLLPAINAIATSLNGVVGGVAGASTTFKELGAIGGVVFGNLGEVVALAIAMIQLKLVQIGAEFAHFFTGTIPALLSWFGKNWSDAWFTYFDLVTTVFINLGENIRNTMSAVWDFISSGGTKELSLAWKPLTEGFVSTLKELPKLPERPIGDLERQLQADVDTLSQSLGQKMVDAMAAVGQSGAAPAALVQNAEEAAAKTGKGNAASSAGALQAGSSQAASAIAKAFNDGRSPSVKLAQQQLAELKKQTKALEALQPSAGSADLLPAMI